MAITLKPIFLFVHVVVTHASVSLTLSLHILCKYVINKTHLIGGNCSLVNIGLPVTAYLFTPHVLPQQGNWSNGDHWARMPIFDNVFLICLNQNLQAIGNIFRNLANSPPRKDPPPKKRGGFQKSYFKWEGSIVSANEIPI